MAVDLGGVRLKNPVGTASGTFGAGWQFERFIDVSSLGFITVKGVSAVPWPGNPQPRMAEVTSGMMSRCAPSATANCSTLRRKCRRALPALFFGLRVSLLSCSRAPPRFLL